MLNRHGILIETIRERWVGEKRYRVLCETREIGSECVTARKEEKVRHVSPFPPTQRLGSVAPLVPRSALERRNFVMVYLHPFVSDLQLSHICLRSSVLIVLIAVTFSPAAQALKLKPSLGTSLTHCRCHCPTPLAVASLSSVPDNP